MKPVVTMSQLEKRRAELQDLRPENACAFRSDYERVMEGFLGMR